MTVKKSCRENMDHLSVCSSCQVTGLPQLLIAGSDPSYL